MALKSRGTCPEWRYVTPAFWNQGRGGQAHVHVTTLIWKQNGSTWDPQFWETHLPQMSFALRPRFWWGRQNQDPKETLMWAP
jgi:hypothetical protein